MTCRKGPLAKLRKATPRRDPLISTECYTFDARRQRHAEAFAERGYDVDVIRIANALTRKDRVYFIQSSMPYYQGFAPLS